MTKKKYIVWDWNGTLLNDVDLCIESINYLLHKHDVETLDTLDAYQRVFQFPIIEYYKKAGFEFEKTPFEELAIDYMAYYQPRSMNCPMHEGVKEVLQYFKDHGFTQYLLSASKLDFLHHQLDNYDIEEYFSDIFGLDNVHAFSKKELADAFIKNQDLPKEAVVFIGDSVHDHEVAMNAGCDCILVANGHEHKEKLLQTGSSVVSTIKDVMQLLID